MNVDSKHRHKPANGIVGLCLLLALIFTGCRDDRNESFYSNFTDAEKAGAVERHWIPAFLPASSSNIHETGDLSPAKVWCAFEFLPANSEQFRMSLKPVGELPASARHVPKIGKPWWPSVLEGNIDVSKVHDAGFQLYLVKEPETDSTQFLYLFAIDWVKGRGYFYLSSSS